MTTVNLTVGTKVVSMLDGELATIIRPSSHNRNQNKAISYLVNTQFGREIWDASDLFIPEGM